MHELSETIQLPSGRWTNINGRTRQPLTSETWPTVEEAVEAAKQRSKSFTSSGENRQLQSPHSSLWDLILGPTPQQRIESLSSIKGPSEGQSLSQMYNQMVKRGFSPAGFASTISGPMPLIKQAAEASEKYAPGLFETIARSKHPVELLPMRGTEANIAMDYFGGASRLRGATTSAMHELPGSEYRVGSKIFIKPSLEETIRGSTVSHETYGHSLFNAIRKGLESTNPYARSKPVVPIPQNTYDKLYNYLPKSAQNQLSTSLSYKGLSKDLLNEEIFAQSLSALHNNELSYEGAQLTIHTLQSLRDMLKGLKY